MRSQLYSWLKFLIGWPFILLAFFFIFKTLYTQAPTLFTSVHRLEPWLLGLGLLCFVLFYFIRGYIWHLILKNYKYKIPFHKSCYLWSISEFKRYIPGSIWAFMGRAFQFEKENVQKKDIAKGLIIEAELFVMGSILISLLALPFLLPSFLNLYTIWFAILVISIVLFYCNAKYISVSFPQKIQKIIAFLLPQFSFYEMLLLVGTSSVALFLFGLGNYLVISAITTLDLQSIFSLIGVFVLAFVAGYLSIITPAGLGVREGILILSLSKIIPSGVAALGAIFSRIMLIVAELIFILLSYLWYKTENKQLRKLEKIITKHPQAALVTILSFIYAAYFTVLSFLRYDNYYTGRFDLGNMAQTVWNSFHGNIFLLTDPNGTEQVSRLAFHADFILVLLTPFYALWENPKMLLLIQTIIIAAGAFFVYLIARDVLKKSNLAVVFSFIYLLNPSVEFTNLYDFHAVTLVTTFFLATYYFFLKKRYTLFVIFAVLAALCKEQIWLIISLFGLLVFFVHKQRLIGSILFVCSAAMFYFLLWYAIPQTLGGQHFALSYLSDYGTSPTEVVKGIVLSPDKILSTVLQEDRILYLKKLFLPVGYLPVLFPFFLIFAAPDLLINILSNNSQLHQIYFQYTATITPFIFLSAIYGVWVLRKFLIFNFQSPVWRIFKQHFALVVSIGLLIMAIQGAYAYGPLPGAKDKNTDMLTKPLVNRAAIDQFLAAIPKNYTVSASNDVGSHLSHRDTIYTVPVGINRADMIALILTDPKAHETYKKVSKDSHYKKVKDTGNFVAFKRIHN